MPIHDWTRVPAGIFHDFHHGWIEEIKRYLNHGTLPSDYYALAEQVTADREPDVLTLQRLANGTPRLSPVSPAGNSGISLATAPPKVRFHERNELGRYAARAKAVTVRHVSNHRVVALIEIVSPGNKSSKARFEDFVDKAQQFLMAGIHLLIADLFPPGSRDPQGIHRAIWPEPANGYLFLPEKPLTCASYIAEPYLEAFVEPVAVGDSLPEMPLFLTEQRYVPLALDTTYQAAWNEVPVYWREVLTEAEKDH